MITVTGVKMAFGSDFPDISIAIEVSDEVGIQVLCLGDFSSTILVPVSEWKEFCKNVEELINAGD